MQVYVSEAKRLMVMPHTFQVDTTVTTSKMRHKIIQHKGKPHVVVAHTPFNTAVISKVLDVDIPTPFQSYYKPPVGKPFAHQLRVADFLSHMHTAFCFADIGTGKTLSSLWSADYLFQIEEIKKMLVLCPKSTVTHVWAREIFKFFPHLKGLAITGDRAKREKLLNQEADIYVVNHDAVKTLESKLKLHRFDLVIVDESTALKTYGTKRHKAFRRIVAHEPKIWLMSGAPTPQGPMDMYGQAKVVCPTAIPKTKTAFQNTFMFKVSEFKWIVKPDANANLHKMIAPYTVRVALEDCYDLPDEFIRSREVDQTKEMARIQKELEKEAAAEMAAGTLVAANEAVLGSKMLQAAAGAVRYTADDGSTTIGHVDCTPKFEALMDIIDASDGPVLVFCSYTAPITWLCKTLAAKGIDVVRVDGTITSTKKRDEAFDAIQNNKAKVLVANPEAMAHGITLTRSNVVVWWGLPWKRESYIQANGRIRRISQRRKMYFLHLLCSDIERHVYTNLKDGLALQGALLNMLKGRA